jgi:hypothetical protein
MIEEINSVKEPLGLPQAEDGIFSGLKTNWAVFKSALMLKFLILISAGRVRMITVRTTPPYTDEKTNKAGVRQRHTEKPIYRVH